MLKKRILSLILAVTMLIGVCPTSVFANEPSDNINLSMKDVNESQNIFSKSYMFNGELKTLYAYNTEAGTCRITGDIPYAGGTFGHISVRNEKGYLEFPFTLSDLEIVCFTDENSAEGCSVLFLTKDKELRNFTFVEEIWNKLKIEESGSYIPKPSTVTGYEAPVIYSNIKKLEKNFFIDYDGVFRVYAGNLIYDIANNVDDFIFLGNNTIKVTYKSGDIDFASVDDLWGGFIDNLPSPFDNSGISGGYYGFEEVNYLSFKNESDGSMTITPSENYLKLDNLLATSGLESLDLSRENASSVNGNTYIYSLFNGNVTLGVVLSDKDVVYSLNISTSDNSTPILLGSGIDTKFGKIEFKYDVYGDSYGNMLLYSDDENVFRDSLNAVLSKVMINPKTSNVYIDHDFFMGGNVDWDWHNYVKYKINGSIFQSGYDLGDYIIDLYVNYSTKEARLTNRNTGEVYDISSDVCFESEYSTSIGDIVESTFNISEYRDTAIFPTLYYKPDLNCIIMSTDSEYDYTSNLRAVLEQTYILKNNQLEDLTADEDYIWHLYNLHCVMRTNANSEALKHGYISKDVSYILSSYFDIDISMQELSTNTNYKYSVLSSDAVYTALFVEYLLYEGNDAYALEFKERFKQSYKDGIYDRDSYLIDSLSDFNIDYMFNMYVDYLLNSEISFKLSDLTHTFKYEKWNDETYTYDYIDYEVKQLPYEGYNLSSTSLILQEQSPLYMTICPYEYSSFMITDTSVVNKNYYALGTNGVLYNIAFDSDYLSEGLNNSWEFNDTSADASIMNQTKIADNVVKVNTLGQYLTSDGKLYTKDGVLLKQGVTNISDNLYELNDTWYYITSNTEFKFNYASDKNIRPLIVKSTDDYITYQFMFNEDIAYMVNPDGDIVKSGGTYTIDTNGYYVFDVVNSYGDKFTEVLVVNHLGTAGLIGISPMVVDRILTLYYESGATIEYSFDNSTWLEYTDKIDMSDKASIYFKGYKGDTSLGKYKLTLDSDSKVNLYNISPAEFNPDNFCGLGYIKDGALFNTENGISVDGVSEVSMIDADNFVYLDDDGNLFVTQHTDVSSNNEGDPGFMPVFRSKKIEFESDITNPVDIYTDGFYTYLLGDSGNLVSVNLGDMIITEYIDTYSYNLYTDWYETWLSSDVVRIHNGIAYKTDGSVINLGKSALSEQEMLEDIKALEFYDKEYNLVSNPIITTFRILEDKVYVLTSSLDVYSGYIRDGYLNYHYTIDLEAQNIDFAIEETDWLNSSSYDVNFTLPDDYEIYAIPNYESSTLYNLSTVQQNALGISDLNLKLSSTGYNNYTYYIKTKDTTLDLSFVADTGYYYIDSPISVYDSSNGTVLRDCVVDIVTDTNAVYNNKALDESLGSYRDGLFKYTYTLQPNTLYTISFYGIDILTDSIGNMFRLNDVYSSLEDYMFTPSYISIESNFGDDYFTEELPNDNFKFTPSTNGIYKVILRNSLGKTISKGSVRVGNLDIYEPKLTTISYNNGVITPIFDDVDDTTGKTSKSGVWTLEYSTDNGVSWNTFEGGLTYSPSTTFNLRRSTVVTEPQVKVRATDKAGNVSDIYTVNLDMNIYEYYVYENGKTTVKFYADADSNWTDSSLSYSYDIGANFVNGHEFSVLVDTDAILKADKDDVIPSSAQKPISIEVVTADKTNTVLTGDVVTVETGNYVNADFYKLYVNIDRAGYQEYTLEEMSKQLGVGYHVIESYYEVVKDGQIIKSPEDLVVVNVPSTPILNNTEIHTDVTYENGKSTLTFYANTDTSNTEFTYSYVINGIETSGHTVVVTEDTLVTLKAVRTGYEDGNKLTNIIVLSTEKPVISDLTNNKYVTINKGAIKNATLDKIIVDINGTITEVTTPSQIFELLNDGTHNIKAYQVVKAFIDGELITITSSEATKSVNIAASEQNEFSLTIRDHFGDKVTVRTVNKVLKGTEYNLSALTVEGWVVEGKTNYTGTISADLVIDFYYKAVPVDDDEPDDDPVIDDDKPEDDPVIDDDEPDDDPIIDEPPKTGDSSNLAVPFTLLIISGLAIIFCIPKRKRA